MDNPDVALEIKRDDNGRVTGLEAKVNRAGDERRGEMEGLEMITHAIDAVFEAEGPEDHGVQVDMTVNLPFGGD